jgi:hypothetical protein
MLRMRAGLAAVCVAAAAALAPAHALADSDPASDFLPTQNVFLPYQPRVSAALTKDLQSITALAAKSGYKIKVAIIATPTDLGGVPDLFNQPARYAAFLGREISFNGAQPLLVVMPNGLGTFAAGPKAAGAVAGVKVGEGADGLARAAIEAVMKLASASGHPVRGFKPSAAASSGGSSGASTALIFGVPLGLLVLGLAILTYRRAGAAEEEEDAETET